MRRVEASTILGVAALVVSVIALCISAFLTYRQIRLARHANHAPALIALYSELRSPHFHARYNYVVTCLAAEHKPDLGIFGLPQDAQTAVLDVAYYYQNLANLMNFGLLDKDKVLPMIRTRLYHTWAAIEPFVEAERKRETPGAPGRLLSILEDNAIEARELSQRIEKGEAIRDLTLRRRVIAETGLIIERLGQSITRSGGR